MAKGNKAFDKDLKYGQSFENLIEEIFTENVKIEVKADRKAIETGNIAIECNNSNQKSGIEATESKHWIHLITEGKEMLGGFIFDVELLKTNLKILKAQKIIKTVMGGDGGASMLILVPLKEVYKLMIRLEDKPNEL